MGATPTENDAPRRRQGDVVLALAMQSKATGITGHDVRQSTGWGDSSKSRALSTLLRDGRLVRLTEIRDGGAVHVCPQYVAGRDVRPYSSLADRQAAKYSAAAILDGELSGLSQAFRIVDDSDSLSIALIALRAEIRRRS